MNFDTRFKEFSGRENYRSYIAASDGVHTLVAARPATKAVQRSEDEIGFAFLSKLYYD